MSSFVKEELLSVVLFWGAGGGGGWGCGLGFEGVCDKIVITDVIKLKRRYHSRIK